MSAIVKDLKAHSFSFFQQILMKLVSKSMVYRAIANKTCLSVGLQSPFICFITGGRMICFKKTYIKKTGFECVINIYHSQSMWFYSENCQ